jgi:predicted HicB family RNase H-like nuclease
MIEYRGYTGILEYDDEFEFFSGHVIGLNDTVYFEGRDAAELKQSMHEAVDRYLALCERRGKSPDKPYSGKFVLRVDPEVHRALATGAAAHHVSMNTYVEDLLKEVMTGG